MCRRIVAACILVFLLATPTAGNQRSSADETGIPYDEFVTLSAAAQASALRQMAPDRRAILKKIHAERWLEKHRASLDASQVAAVQAAIDLLSPGRSGNRQDPASIEREAQVAHRLWCAIGEERALEAFTFRDQAPTVDRSWSALLDSWAQWLVECVIG